ncbi:hypothetical protein [Actinacidiphila glaucinigra]|uniref:Uncharacterized protein n=1 Tax=Actinacidiphila glaucinigra TaxID=235986 RepID=A0A239P141_9ACTN|nr:hypothetical protein [Actinacidiphila glaucinigra]SNT60816.1 hypothetical protein SAMN05216252_1772 [Actinacidiphila glaucinigra]
MLVNFRIDLPATFTAFLAVLVLGIVFVASSLYLTGAWPPEGGWPLLVVACLAMAGNAHGRRQL